MWKHMCAQSNFKRLTMKRQTFYAVSGILCKLEDSLAVKIARVCLRMEDPVENIFDWTFLFVLTSIYLNQINYKDSE